MRVTEVVLSDTQTAVLSEADIQVMTQDNVHYWTIRPGSRIYIHVGPTKYKFEHEATVTNNLVLKQ